MTQDPLDAALEEWIERSLAGEQLDAESFAREKGLPPERLVPRIQGARWLVGRHDAARGGPSATSIPSLPFELGDVEVLEETGRGAMGVVFRGIQRSLGRQVAVKVLQAGGREGSKGRARFLQEARAAARLHHQNLVPVLFVGEEKNLGYYVMEWVEGESLAAILERRSAEPLAQDPIRHRESALLVSKVARALQHAHEQGLLHRDVKPSNILVDTTGEPRLADFGLVRDLSAVTLTATGEVVGSPAYMTPEQVRGDKVLDARTDVYSLGVTLYECMTLRRPFASESLDGIRREILDAVVEEPRAIDASVPDDLQWVALKAMAREPTTRYPSAAAFAADLEAFLRREPVQARPPSAVLKLRRLLVRKRRPILAAAGLACAALLVFGLVTQARQLDDVTLQQITSEVLLEKLVGDGDSLREVLDRAVTRFPAHEAFLLERSLHYLEEGNGSRALADLERARRVASNRDLEQLVEQMNLAAMVSERKDLSAEQAELVKRLASPGQAPKRSLIIRGGILGFLGRWKEAESLYLEARRLDPRDTTIAGRLVTAYEALGDYARAKRELEKFTASRSSPHILYRRFHSALLASDAAAARDEAQQLETEFPSSGWTLAAKLRLPGQQNEVISRVEALLEGKEKEKPPDWNRTATDVLRALGGLYEATKKHEKAARVWSKILEKRPKDANVRGMLATDLFALGRKKKALEHFHQAAVDADHLPYQRDVHWGTYHYFAGNHDEAIPHLQESVRKCPGDPTRWRALAGAQHGKADTVKGAERIRWLRASVEAQEMETRVAPTRSRAWDLLLMNLDHLISALEESSDPDLEATRHKRDQVAEGRREALAAAATSSRAALDR